MRWKRRNFLLLEVLIALFLVTLCLFPLIFPHVKMVLAQKNMVVTQKEFRKRDRVFAELVCQLYEGQWKFEELKRKKEVGGVPVTFHFVRQKESEQASYYLLEVALGDEDPLLYYLFFST